MITQTMRKKHNTKQTQVNLKKFQKTLTKFMKKELRKLCNNKSISKKWKKFTTVKDSTPGKMHGNLKTHNIGNPTRAITSDL